MYEFLARRYACYSTFGKLNFAMILVAGYIKSKRFDQINNPIH